MKTDGFTLTIRFINKLKSSAIYNNKIQRVRTLHGASYENKKTKRLKKRLHTSAKIRIYPYSRLLRADFPICGVVYNQTRLLKRKKIFIREKAGLPSLTGPNLYISTYLYFFST